MTKMEAHNKEREGTLHESHYESRAARAVARRRKEKRGERRRTLKEAQMKNSESIMVS